MGYTEAKKRTKNGNPLPWFGVKTEVFQDQNSFKLIITVPGPI